MEEHGIVSMSTSHQTMSKNSSNLYRGLAVNVDLSCALKLLTGKCFTTEGKLLKSFIEMEWKLFLITVYLFFLICKLFLLRVMWSWQSPFVAKFPKLFFAYSRQLKTYIDGSVKILYFIKSGLLWHLDDAPSIILTALFWRMRSFPVEGWLPHIKMP